MTARDRSSMRSWAMRRGSLRHWAVTLCALLVAAPAHAQDAPTEAPAGSPSDTAQPDATLIGPTTEWRICNETSYVLRLSSAFLRGGRMVAKGWDEALPGTCNIQITPVDSPRFLFAESATLHLGGVREWKGETKLCVGEDDYESDATEDCRLSNRTPRGFFAVRPGEPVTTLVEPDDFGPFKAVIAAQQRLLRDAGYDVSRIDGLTGRKTSAIIRSFRKDAGLEATVDGEPLLRAMMEAARARRDTVGLEVCNEGTQTVWSAVATRRDGQWRSRGWWRSDPGACARPLDVPLPGTDAHVFAVQKGEDGAPDRRLRTASAKPAQFCIAESRFDARGNEFCADKGYGIGSFRPVPTDAPGARMRLTDSDFAEENPLGLR